MKTFVVSHVTVVMSYLVVTLGHVRVMGGGIVQRLFVGEVFEYMSSVTLNINKSQNSAYYKMYLLMFDH